MLHQMYFDVDFGDGMWDICGFDPRVPSPTTTRRLIYHIVGFCAGILSSCPLAASFNQVARNHHPRSERPLSPFPLLFARSKWSCESEYGPLLVWFFFPLQCEPNFASLPLHDMAAASSRPSSSGSIQARCHLVLSAKTAILSSVAAYSSSNSLSSARTSVISVRWSRIFAITFACCIPISAPILFNRPMIQARVEFGTKYTCAQA